MSAVPPDISVRLNAAEYEVLQELARFHDMTETGVMRQALRLYQMVHVHAMRGERVAFLDESGAVIASRPMMATMSD
ncbi:hypothetical protein [Mycolicibacterium sp.]|uniref:hypothetical protein n=1 Tax=Mycolicibacterium sp. TaxID=2320850 RepID=UPI0037C68509